ncbi:hypothetical protein SAMN04489712_108279 [Thermomonospora echinospora]|uniref:Ig-like domain (Group 3) n=1 Tax=Thermomonospora echinospora TaxID=1992 RepID=A0A1H6C2W5_9ACTN|nr:hypothetical protein [Thermomonospora echinospora]SEG67350.1 hypothetical protein SAMN04489712_108279 [Thermomonospora echinospora]
MKRRFVVALLMTVALVTVPGQQASAAACRPALTGFTAPAVAHAGDEVSGEVSLSCAPGSNVKISLRSDRSSLAVPATVTVRRGQTRAAVPLTVKPVEGPQYTARVTAGYKGRSLARDVTVNPGLKMVEIPPSTAPNFVSLYILFTGPAPAGGMTVRMASDNPAVTVPETEFFQEGTYGGGVGGIQVRPVTEDTKVTISFTLGARTLTASKVLVPPFDGSQKVSIHPENSGGLYGLQHFEQFNVVLANPAPEGGVPVQVSVVDDDPAVRLESSIGSIGEGDTRGSFYLSTADVTRTTRVTLKATAFQATAFLEITIHPRITAVTLPESVKSGTSFEGTITLAGPSDVDTAVFLQSSWGILDVPGPMTIPAGATSATFQATSVQVDEPSNVFVTAHLGRTDIQSNWVTLTP